MHILIEAYTFVRFGGANQFYVVAGHQTFFIRFKLKREDASRLIHSKFIDHVTKISIGIVQSQMVNPQCAVFEQLKVLELVTLRTVLKD
uniref:Uncharacterized protein n=1 Tax=Romanomermis culicivorax TaxID=13658 RepID=A0A915HMB1_ROMCU